MNVITGSNRIRKFKYPVLTIGNFDGLHKGHLAIIKKVVSFAKEHQGTSVLYTFEPHPVKFLSPELAPPMLQTLAQKDQILASLGLDLVILEPFNVRLAKLSPDEFFKKIVCDRIGARELVVGYDFTFGSHKSGGIETLKKLAKRYDVGLHVIKAVFVKESLLSSTHIRHFIERGEIVSANKMLGHCYSLEGTVEKGLGIGGKLGFHTANLAVKNELIPPPGVYITETRIEGSKKKYRSITNIGYNPTFAGTRLSIETHILDLNKNLLNKHLEIGFHKKIRREITFESLQALREQIQKDILKVRKYYEKRILV